MSYFQNNLGLVERVKVYPETQKIIDPFLKKYKPLPMFDKLPCMVYKSTNHEELIQLVSKARKPSESNS